MGSSKVILLSGVYLILGFYTLSFNSTNEANFSNALSVASSLQTEQLARTGLALSLQKLGNNPAVYSFAEETLQMNNGTITYQANRPVGFPATQTQVVSTALFNNQEVTMTAVYHFQNGRWKILKVYTSLQV